MNPFIKQKYKLTKNPPNKKAIIVGDTSPSDRNVFIDDDKSEPLAWEEEEEFFDSLLEYSKEDTEDLAILRYKDFVQLWKNGDSIKEGVLDEAIVLKWIE